MIPRVYPAYAIAIARSTTIFWVAIRVVMSLGAGEVALTFVASVMLAVVVAGLVWLEGRLLRDRVFHANLGTATSVPPSFALVLVLLCELVIAAVFG